MCYPQKEIVPPYQQLKYRVQKGHICFIKNCGNEVERWPNHDKILDLSTPSYLSFSIICVLLAKIAYLPLSYISFKFGKILFISPLHQIFQPFEQIWIVLQCIFLKFQLMIWDSILKECLEIIGQNKIPYIFLARSLGVVAINMPKKLIPLSAMCY